VKQQLKSLILILSVLQFPHTESQLSAWKLRVESTPTQLDDMLSEYTTKNADLEQKVAMLEIEMRDREKRHKEDLEKRDEAAEILKQELERAREGEAVARQERDSMRDELSALSSAYSGLEEEFRRQQSASLSTAGPTGQDTSSGEQKPEGELITGCKWPWRD